jgi:hypothetical protein
VTGSLKKLAEWKGEFVDLGYALEFSDVLHGSVLLRTGVEAHNDLDRIDFDLDPKDGFSGKAPVRISIDPKDPVQRGIVRLSNGGGVAALLRGGSGAWSIYDGESVAPLPEPLKTTEFPLDVCFLNNSTPILLVGGKEAGFRVLTAGGDPLPRGHG